MEDKEDNVSFSNDPGRGLSSPNSDNKTGVKPQRESEVSVVSSERVQLGLQTTVRSDLSSVAGKDSKDSNAVEAEVSREESTNKAQSPRSQLKTLSSSSKESVNAQLSSVDQKLRQSSNENNTASGCSRLSDGSFCVPGEKDSSHDPAKKADSVVDRSKKLCNFDLNEGMEPITVVAKVGVLVGEPEKPLKFGGELGWRSSVTTSAFRPTFSPRQSLASQGIDLNIAATMDSEDYNAVDFTSKNFHKQGSSRFDLNDSLTLGYSRKKTSEIGQTREISRNYMSESRTPSSYWVDLSSMQGFNHIHSRPFLQMVVPIQSEMSLLPSTFYPSGTLPHLSGSVVGAYPQVLYPIRSSFAQNGGVALMENRSRGERSVESLMPMRNGFPPLPTKRREPEGGWDYSQVNHRTVI